MKLGIAGRYRREINSLILFLVLAVSLYVLISYLFWPSAFFTVPILSIAASIASLYMVSSYLEEPLWRIFTGEDRPTAILSLALLLNVIYDAAIIMLRASPDGSTAAAWGIPVMGSTYLLLVGLSYLMLVFPRRLLSRNTVNILIYGMLLFSIFFILPVYTYRGLTHDYSGQIPRMEGVFPELAVMGAVLGPYSILASLFFFFSTTLMLVSTTYQYLTLDNMSLRKYYRIIWASFTLAIGISIAAILIFAAVFHTNYFMLYSLETLIFTPAVVYYITHISMVKRKLSLLRSGTQRKGRSVIYVQDGPEDVEAAKKELLKHINEGRKAIILSDEPPSEFLPGNEPLPEDALYIQITEERYRISNTIFRSIEDILAIHGGDIRDFHGIVVYVDTISHMIKQGVTSEEEFRYYFLLKEIVEGGGIVLGPVPRRFLQVHRSAKVIRTENPLWYMKPLMILRLEEHINEIYRRAPPERREALKDFIAHMDGQLSIKDMGGDHIYLNHRADMTRERFMQIIRELRAFSSSKGILSESDFDELAREIFSRYGDDYDAMILIKEGMVYFINGASPEKASLEKAEHMVNMGKKCLVISRTNPGILREMYYFEGDVEIKWLTDVGEGDDILLPHLESVKKEVFDFLERNDRAVIVLDGMEYLTRMHGFQAILGLLWIMKDRLATTDSIVLIPVNLKALDERDAETLKREFPFL